MTIFVNKHKQYLEGEKIIREINEATRNGKRMGCDKRTEVFKRIIGSQDSTAKGLSGVEKALTLLIDKSKGAQGYRWGD